MPSDNNITLWNANILTLDPTCPKAEALAVERGKIARVGTNQDILKLHGEGWDSVDLQGKTVLPGFIDSHVHFLPTALTAIGINLAEARTVDEILLKVEDKAKETPPGDWILGYFITYLSDRGMPTRYDLDRVSTAHPIRLTYLNGHLCSLNTKALEILNVSKDLEGVEKVAGEGDQVVYDQWCQIRL